ncbi:hypothetical protein [Winogradskyella sp. SYSU M77433]|uniref:outer membrane beta-barrel protein n=1 Tax=Winogradskyella sp. SYSU M77433 TaxID=3042722 RepID=UPI0024819486|nr:hypothetical protein [Winogradskyella sp. SYSU M77433]MDH7912518.1 hypothetical protein [Winogradskyella sp. SYSU M77433]
MKNFTLIIICFAFTLMSFAQDENIKSKFSYGLNLAVGGATLENNKVGLLNGNVFAIRFNVDYDFSDNEKTKLLSGVEIVEFNSSFFNGTDQSRLKNEYLQIPLRLVQRVSLDNEQKFNLVTSISAYGNFLLRSKINDLSNEVDTKSGGVNFGVGISFGTDYEITSNTRVNILFDIMNETSSISKNGFRQKQKDIYLLGIGFMTRF